MSDVSQQRVDKGYEQFIQMLGEARAAEVRSQWHRISPEFEKFVLGILAGEVWTRPGLDLRTRSLATIAGLTGLGRPRALALNIEMALRNGASRDEIRETILQMAFYAGFPAAWEGLQTADEVFQKVFA
ncbi:MAG: 4-carboxymuconolactone decarboxylase [Acidobacteria bacterium]|nr:MAG: 4-carboxymuconolactone decarboxylase [Acidobacteriota bacterium]